MDDATRAELAELRRRAFGPDPDIADDPAALARLAELEGMVRSALPVSAGSAAPVEAGDPDPSPLGVVPVLDDDDAAESAADAAPPDERGLPRSARPRRGARLGIALAVGAAVVVGGALLTPDFDVVGEPAASPTAPAPSAPIAPLPSGALLIEIPLDRSLARYVVEPSPAPAFPVPEDLQWTSMLGTYYGWDLWLARSRSGFPCILVTRDGESKGQCVPEQVFFDNTLGVAISYADIDREIRPPGMTATERIEYWWLPQRGVVVMRGGGSITYFGRSG